MPEEKDLSHWPKLLKYSTGFADLFPRIAWRDRDQNLECVLAKHITNPSDTSCCQSDLREASRRIREAIRHDAYVGVQPATRNALSKAFKALEEASKQFSSIDQAGQLKAIRLGFADAIADQDSKSIDLIEVVANWVDRRDQIVVFLDELPQSRKGEDTLQYSVIERLIESWKVIEGEAPAVVKSPNFKDDERGRKFEKCLQDVFDQQSSATGLKFVTARQAMDNWSRNKQAKRPPNDQLPLE